jgi:hypothetical protein
MGEKVWEKCEKRNMARMSKIQVGKVWKKM